MAAREQRHERELDGFFFSFERGADRIAQPMDGRDQLVGDYRSGSGHVRERSTIACDAVERGRKVPLRPRRRLGSDGLLWAHLDSV